jgi:hypothetical protein
MRMLEKNWVRIYHSQRMVSSSGVEGFSTPTPIDCNLIPLTTDWTLAEKGAVEKGMMKFTLPRDSNLITFGDRFYVDTVPPVDYQDVVTAEGATHMVSGVEPTLNYVTIILKRISG